jgi:hypothetical protein
MSAGALNLHGLGGNQSIELGGQGRQLGRGRRRQRSCFTIAHRGHGAGKTLEVEKPCPNRKSLRSE